MSANSYRKRLTPAESLLLVIDLQEKFVPYLKHRKRAVRTAGMLIRVARELHVPVVVTEHNPERIGPTVDEVAFHLKTLEGFEFYRKDIFSCLGDAKVREGIARHAGVKSILIVGCETHVCVMQTTIDALEAGYNVHVAADGVSSRGEIDWITGLNRIEKAGAVVATAEMIAYELLGRSDTKEFKALLPVFKEWTAKEGEGE